MADLSVDTIGPLRADDDGFQHILVIIDNFSKFVMLYPTVSTDAASYVKSLLHHIGLFGIPQRIRSDGGTQFTAGISQQLASFLGYTHIVILPYHPQANGIVERHNAEIMKHLRAMILEGASVKQWSIILPLVQRIINSSYHSAIDTYPARLLFGDSLPIYGPLLCTARSETLPVPVNEYIEQLMTNLENVVIKSQEYLNNHLRRLDDRHDSKKSSNSHSFAVGDYVLVTYPSRPPHKLASPYRGPLKIVECVRDDIYRCLELASNQVLEFHVDRLRPFHSRATNNEAVLGNLAAADSDMFMVEAIIDHRCKTRRRTNMAKQLEYRIRWTGYSPDEDTWQPYRDVKDLEAFHQYLTAHPDITL
jgi:transposase InsO family protein